MSSVEPSLAGPKRPQDRVPLKDMKAGYEKSLVEMLSAGKSKGEDDEGGGKAKAAKSATVNGTKETPRNAPCPCGSGKKYKQCHGAAGAN